MYGAYANGTNITDNIKDSMKEYGGKDKHSYIETFTLTKDAKVIDISEIGKLNQDFNEKVNNEFKKRGGYKNNDAMEWADDISILANNAGTLATAYGYDAIVDSKLTGYTVILNRTKCIFKRS